MKFKSFNIRNAALIVQVLAIVVFLLYYIKVNSYSKPFDRLNSSPADYFLPLIAVLSIVVIFMSKYLTDKEGLIDNIVTDQRILKLQNTIRQLELEKINQGNTSEVEYTDVEMMEDTLIDIENNILKYLYKLSRNSNLNLIIGVVGTITAISVLATSLLFNERYLTYESFLLNFIPKISFVVFIQLFAFFFLRLYKANLEDTKYFQNELTNILAKSAAIKLASYTEDKILISALLLDLSKTERNFKLAAGESLMNLEKHKIEKDFDLESLRMFKEFLKFKQSDEKK